MLTNSNTNKKKVKMTIEQMMDNLQASAVKSAAVKPVIRAAKRK